MDKTYLEKRIHEIAEEQADQYFQEISYFFNQHVELVANGREGLMLKPVAENRSIRFRSPFNDESLFNSQENLSKYTNWQDIRKELVEKYEKEEVNELLSKFEN